MHTEKGRMKSSESKIQNMAFEYGVRKELLNHQKTDICWSQTEYYVSYFICILSVANVLIMLLKFERCLHKV